MRLPFLFLTSAEGNGNRNGKSNDKCKKQKQVLLSA
jgi:hypothetical protein